MSPADGPPGPVQQLPELLVLADAGDRRYRLTQPAESPEGRDVVYSGQLLAQMIMAADRSSGGVKDVRSAHAIFARAGSTTKPIEVDVDPIQAGRTWASDTVTAVQDGKVLCRALVLSNTVDPDLMRHQPDVPAGAGDPDGLAPAPGLVFPGAELRPVPGEPTAAGVPVELAWHRFTAPLPTPAAHQAVLTWATCGSVIGLAMRPHRDTVRLSDAHRTLSTGVIAHTVHFVERFDVTQWLLIVTEATKAATGRVLGGGRVFTADGTLVATFEQDSMARAAAGALDPGSSL